MFFPKPPICPGPRETPSRVRHSAEGFEKSCGPKVFGQNGLDTGAGVYGVPLSLAENRQAVGAPLLREKPYARWPATGLSVTLGTVQAIGRISCHKSTHLVFSRCMHGVAVDARQSLWLREG